MTPTDIRQTHHYQEASELYTKIRQPGTGQISDAEAVNGAPDGRFVVFAGAILDSVDGDSGTRICTTDLESGATRILTLGPNSDRLPKYSPRGDRIAFLSDRQQAGNFKLYLLNPELGEARPTPPIEGWVEYFQWCSSGKFILLGVAGHGADVSGGQGAVTSKQAPISTPSWAPTVDSGNESFRWRGLSIYNLESEVVRGIDHNGINIWEASWCGTDSIVAVVSGTPDEGHWYTARLALIDISSGRCEEIYKPDDQIGVPTADPSGKYIAFIESLASDRGFIAGKLLIIDRTSRRTYTVDCRGIDVSYLEWRSARRLLVAGHRDTETVVGTYDIDSESVVEIWSSREITSGGIFAAVSGVCGDSGDCVLIGEGFKRAPEVGLISGGVYRSVKSFDVGYSAAAESIKTVESVTWRAPDNLEIQGWLLLPHHETPHALVMNVHGGPVWQMRSLWLGRRSAPTFLMLLAHGYAIFFPNPRGSSGKGQIFTRGVLGDLGGADARDLLAGLDALVERGIAEPNRIGVMGTSYGGFMTCWLVTQDPRFAAAVAISPHTNQVTQRLLSNIPQFADIFLADDYANPGGNFFQRSPVMFASRAATPTLNICGALDRCTPPTEAAQFHRALLEYGVESVLVTYPEEGHGVRKFPAVLDFSARVVSWFESHMGPECGDLEKVR